MGKILYLNKKKKIGKKIVQLLRVYERDYCEPPIRKDINVSLIEDYK